MAKLPKAILSSAVLAAALGLAACQGGEKTASAEQGGDKYAGLDGAIRNWHGEIKQADAQCKGRPEAEQCRAFEVACKGEREVAPGEAAQGVSAKVAVAMGWEGWDTDRAEYRPASAVAEFQKVSGEWKRLPTGPVNLATCVAS